MTVAVLSQDTPIVNNASDTVAGVEECDGDEVGAVEFGKGEVESVEYKYDIIVQEVESGVYLGPTLR